MAKKCEFKNKPAYQEGPLILQLKDDKLWYVYHKLTERKIMGPNIGPWKQKRDALSYAKALINNMNMSFSSKEEMYEKNGGKSNLEELRIKSYNEGILND